MLESFLVEMICSIATPRSMLALIYAYLFLVLKVTNPREEKKRKMQGNRESLHTFDHLIECILRF